MESLYKSISSGQIEVLDVHVQLRRAMHEFYVALFTHIKEVTVYTVPNEDYFTNYC